MICIDIRTVWSSAHHQSSALQTVLNVALGLDFLFSFFLIYGMSSLIEEILAPLVEITDWSISGTGFSLETAAFSRFSNIYCYYMPV